MNASQLLEGGVSHTGERKLIVESRSQVVGYGKWGNKVAQWEPHNTIGGVCAGNETQQSVIFLHYSRLHQIDNLTRAAHQGFFF